MLGRRPCPGRCLPGRDGPGKALSPPTARASDPHRYAVLWLALVTALWCVLLAGSAEFLLAGVPAVLPAPARAAARIALLTIALMTAAVIAAQWTSSGLPQPAAGRGRWARCSARVFAWLPGLHTWHCTGKPRTSAVRPMSCAEPGRSWRAPARRRGAGGAGTAGPGNPRHSRPGFFQHRAIARAAEKSLADGDAATAGAALCAWFSRPPRRTWRRPGVLSAACRPRSCRGIPGGESAPALRAPKWRLPPVGWGGLPVRARR